MYRESRGPLWAAVIAGALLWACTDDVGTRPELPVEVGSQEGPTLVARNGGHIPEARMRALLTEVTRDLAKALADPQVRSLVHAELHTSPYREHKLHFGPFLRAKGQRLLAGAAAARGATADAVLAALDSILDLEFYIPVDRHFAAWEGGPDLIVASALHDDGTAPVGFDLAGDAVTLSATEPPAVPTLVVRPVETDFSRRPNPPVAPSAVNAVASTLPGVYMTSAYIPDPHEGWSAGAPEFEVHAFVTNDAGQYTDRICAGEFQDQPYQYNHDGISWAGSEVLLATEAIIGDWNNVQFQVWENDTDACTVTDGRPPRTDDATIQQWSAWGASVANVIVQVVDGNPVKIIGAALAAIGATWTLVSSLNRDDEVGAMVFANDCWPEASGPVSVEIRKSSNGHPVAGNATLDFRFGQERDPICPLDATINGPVWIENRDGVNNPAPRWTAGVTGGIGPITYTWYENGVFVSSTSEYDMGYVGAGTYVIRLDVTRGSDVVTESITVTVQDVCTGCPESPPAFPGKGSELREVNRPQGVAP